MSIWITIIIIVITLILQAFFSGIEIGIISISKIKLLKDVKKKRKGARIIQRLLQKPERLLGTTLVGTNISIVVSSSLLTGLLYEKYPDLAEYISLLILTPLSLIFCEAIPKAIFREYKNSITVFLAPILEIGYYIFYPIVEFVTFISKMVIRIIGGKKVEKSPYITREELQIITLESYPGKEDEALRKIARRIFYFGEKTAGNIMIDLDDIIALEKTQTIKELRDTFEKVKFSKYPIYSRKPDNLIGFVNIRDILDVGDNKRISGFIREVLIVDKNTGLEELLSIFKKGVEQVAFVKGDESIIGMISLEDVLEELVGDIKDEYENS